MTLADSEAIKLWSFWYNVSVGAVILGVALEVPEVVRRASKWLSPRPKKQCVVEPWYDAPPESKSPNWLHSVEGFGWFILLIGLTLEQWSHVQITDIKDREIASLTSKLGATTAIAAEANERASSNELQVAQLTHDNLVLRSNVAAMDPATKPVNVVYAIATFKVSNNSLDTNFLASGMRCGKVSFNRPGEFQIHGVIDLDATGHSIEFDEDRGLYTLEFRPKLKTWGEVGLVGLLTNKLVCAKMFIWCFKSDIDFVEGEIHLYINGSVVVNFPVPPQKAVGGKMVDTWVRGNKPPLAVQYGYLNSFSGKPNSEYIDRPEFLPYRVELTNEQNMASEGKK